MVAFELGVRRGQTFVCRAVQTFRVDVLRR